MKTKRIESIDIARGIGILLVIWGHLTVDGQLSRYTIFTFHMPLFFMLSGIFAAKSKDLAKSAVKLVRTTLVPYLTVVALDILPRAYLAAKGGSFNLETLIKSTIMCALGIGLTYNRAVWFLFSLFIIKAVFLLAEQIKNKVAKDSVILAICAASLVFILTRRLLELPQYNMYLTTCGCFVFFGAGYYLRDVILNLEDSVRKHKIHLVIAPALAAVVVLIARYVKLFLMHTYEYTDHPFLALIAAVCGCYVTLVASSFIATLTKADVLKKLLIFYGKNSIVILLLHYPLARRFYPLIFGAIGLEKYIHNPAAEIILFVITAALMIPAIYLFNKYLYFIIGNKKPARP
ncbi:MAG: acyltransferase family protein [Eubacterium sp.]|nr:acyltransferase family protein [Eubacterium sp.]